MTSLQFHCSRCCCFRVWSSTTKTSKEEKTKQPLTKMASWELDYPTIFRLHLSLLFVVEFVETYWLHHYHLKTLWRYSYSADPKRHNDTQTATTPDDDADPPLQTQNT